MATGGKLLLWCYLDLLISLRFPHQKKNSHTCGKDALNCTLRMYNICTNANADALRNAHTEKTSWLLSSSHTNGVHWPWQLDSLQSRGTNKEYFDCVYLLINFLIDHSVNRCIIAKYVINSLSKPLFDKTNIQNSSIHFSVMLKKEKQQILLYDRSWNWGKGWPSCLKKTTGNSTTNWSKISKILDQLN